VDCLVARRINKNKKTKNDAGDVANAEDNEDDDDEYADLDESRPVLLPRTPAKKKAAGRARRTTTTAGAVTVTASPRVRRSTRVARGAAMVSGKS
jgi:hypothetical protein